MEEAEYKRLAKEMIDWFSLPEHYSIVHFAIEQGMSKEELFRIAGDNGELQKALDYALSVQEYKVSEGAITGALDKNVSLRMLETFNGWKGEVNILQRNEYKQFMNEAKVKAESILSSGREVVSGDVDSISSDNSEDNFGN